MVSTLDEENDLITWILPEDPATDNILLNIDPAKRELTPKQDSTINFEMTARRNVLIIAKNEFLLRSQDVDTVVGDVNDASSFVTYSLTISYTINIGSTIMS